jgi:hypothetical protein
MDVKQSDLQGGVDLKSASIEPNLGISNETEVAKESLTPASVLHIEDQFSAGLRDYSLNTEELVAVLSQPESVDALARLDDLAVAPALQVYALLAHERHDGSPLNNPQDRLDYAIALSESDEFDREVSQVQTRLAAIAALGDRIPHGQDLAVSYLSAAYGTSIDTAREFCDRREKPINDIFDVPERLSYGDRALLTLVDEASFKALQPSSENSGSFVYQLGRTVSIPGVDGAFRVADGGVSSVMLTPREGGYSFKMTTAELAGANPPTLRERVAGVIESARSRAASFGL